MPASQVTFMRAARTLFAVLIAASVAMLPAAGFAVAGGGHAGMAMSADMSEAMDDCCPGDVKPCAAGDCRAMASCAFKCFNLAPFTATGAPHPLERATQLALYADAAVPVYRGAPPFRPPRV